MNIKISGTEKEVKCLKDFLLRDTVHQMMSIRPIEKIEENLFTQELEYVVNPVRIITKYITKL